MTVAASIVFTLTMMWQTCRADNPALSNTIRFESKSEFEQTITPFLASAGGARTLRGSQKTDETENAEGSAGSWSADEKFNISTPRVLDLQGRTYKQTAANVVGSGRGPTSSKVLIEQIAPEKTTPHSGVYGNSRDDSDFSARHADTVVVTRDRSESASVGDDKLAGNFLALPAFVTARDEIANGEKSLIATTEHREGRVHQFQKKTRENVSSRLALTVAEPSEPAHAGLHTVSVPPTSMSGKKAIEQNLLHVPALSQAGLPVAERSFRSTITRTAARQARTWTQHPSRHRPEESAQNRTTSLNEKRESWASKGLTPVLPSVANGPSKALVVEAKNATAGLKTWRAPVRQRRDAAVAVGDMGSFAYMRKNDFRGRTDEKTRKLGIGRVVDRRVVGKTSFAGATGTNTFFKRSASKFAVVPRNDLSHRPRMIPRTATDAVEDSGQPFDHAVFPWRPRRGDLRMHADMVATSIGSAFSTMGLLCIKKSHRVCWEDVSSQSRPCGSPAGSLIDDGRSFFLQSPRSWQLLAFVCWCLFTATWMFIQQTLLQQFSFCFRGVDVIMSIEAAHRFFGERTRCLTRRGSQLLVCSSVWSLMFEPKITRNMSMQQLLEHCLRVDCLSGLAVVVLFLLSTGMLTYSHRHRLQTSMTILQCTAASAVLAWYTKAAFAGMVMLNRSNPNLGWNHGFSAFAAMFTSLFGLQLVCLSTALEKAAMGIVVPFYAAVTLIGQSFFRAMVFIQNGGDLVDHLGFWPGVVGLIVSAWILLAAGVEVDDVHQNRGLILTALDTDKVQGAGASVGDLVRMKDSWLRYSGGRNDSLCTVGQACSSPPAAAADATFVEKR
eukprot:TRINITY_DN29236_c0_g1_i1.p1 TRINITY_DN29236_c0_g1~~TRINITY_DN29236_c0_g1_i1.p1  ORF type:complete len:838 (-),score=86.07 TRINITY_DN29236_c0_g1_i1:69-2582(-)